jgi:hypothetical protein
MSATKHFVFLEFTNSEVSAVLTKLRYALSGARHNDPIHITVRGPYKDRPKIQTLQDNAERLEGDYVFIADPGVFVTNKGYAVYLNAVSRVFESGIWWKPDFKNEKKTPHITLYETNNSDHAAAVCSFLKSERIEIKTYGLALSVYTSKQRTLLLDDAQPILIPQHGSLDRINVRDNLIARAEQLHEHLFSPIDDREAFQLALV